MSRAPLQSAGLLWLLRPKVMGKLARFRTDRGRSFKTAVLLFVGLFFWALIFGVIWLGPFTDYALAAAKSFTFIQ